MSVPARSGTKMSASALVRLKCGSTWITVAPRAFASITHWNATGCASAMFEPSMHDAVGVLQVAGNVVDAAAAERRAQPDDGGAVADARLVLDLHHAERGEAAS